MSLPAPFTGISPLIKVSRWTLLGLGIMWGRSRYVILSDRENKLREIEEAERPAREAALAQQKAQKYKEDMEYLGRETGVIPGGPMKMSTPGSEPPPGGSGSGQPVGSFSSECGCRY